MHGSWGSAGIRNGVQSQKKSTKGKYFRSSLQCLDNNEILLLLESILQRSKQGTQANCMVRGLRAVQEHLMHGCGYLHLEEAYNLYSQFNECSCPNKQAFRDKLLDPHHGLTLLSLIKAYYTIFSFLYNLEQQCIFSQFLKS